MEKNLEKLEGIIGYIFKDKHLLSQAMTHSSYANEKSWGKRAAMSVWNFWEMLFWNLSAAIFFLLHIRRFLRASLQKNVPAWCVSRVLLIAPGNLGFRSFSFLEKEKT